MVNIREQVSNPRPLYADAAPFAPAATEPPRAPARAAQWPEPPAPVDLPLGFHRLTDRELQILSLVAEGNTNRVIGETLNISERTVKNHLTCVMTKLQASDRTHAVVTALRLGMLSI